MTICIAVKTHESIVFVADSATSLASVDQNGAPLIHRVYNHADKVFNLYRGLPICAMTCGLGNFGTESIATIAKGVRRALMSEEVDDANRSVEHAFREAYETFKGKFDALDDGIRNNTTFEFFVGGFSPANGGNELWKFTFNQGQSLEPECIADVDEWPAAGFLDTELRCSA